jgi:hypothetical protein
MSIDCDNLIKKIYEFENECNSISNTELCFADEIHAANTYYESSYKVNRLAESSYTDMHFKIKDTYYDLFYHIDEEIDTDNLYQIIVCNNYYQIFKFRQNDYDRRKLVSEFRMPGKVYSFYSGSVIIVATDKPCSDNRYKELT